MRAKKNRTTEIKIATHLIQLLSDVLDENEISCIKAFMILPPTKSKRYYEQVKYPVSLQNIKAGLTPSKYM